MKRHAIFASSIALLALALNASGYEPKGDVRNTESIMTMAPSGAMTNHDASAVGTTLQSLRGNPGTLEIFNYGPINGAAFDPGDPYAYAQSIPALMGRVAWSTIVGNNVFYNSDQKWEQAIQDAPLSYLESGLEGMTVHFRKEGTASPYPIIVNDEHHVSFSVRAAPSHFQVQDTGINMTPLRHIGSPDSTVQFEVPATFINSIGDTQSGLTSWNDPLDNPFITMATLTTNGLGAIPKALDLWTWENQTNALDIVFNRARGPANEWWAAWAGQDLQYQPLAGDEVGMFRFRIFNDVNATETSETAYEQTAEFGSIVKENLIPTRSRQAFVWRMADEEEAMPEYTMALNPSDGLNLMQGNPLTAGGSPSISDGLTFSYKGVVIPPNGYPRSGSDIGAVVSTDDVGGMILRGFSPAINATPVTISGVVGNSVGPNGVSRPVFKYDARVWDGGTGTRGLTSSEYLMSFYNRFDPVFFVLGDGSIHPSGSYYSSDNSMGLTTNYTVVAGDELVIKDGIITDIL